MTGSKNLIIIDLGMQSLRMAEFAHEPDGVIRMLWGARRDFLLDPALDASRADQTRLAAQEIIKSSKTKTKSTRLVLPSQSVFMRVIALEVPGGDPSQIAAMARFEAQQNIPFPLEEVVWDYSIMGTLPSGAVNILFLAVKTDLLESLAEAIQSTGLKIDSITVAPLAIRDLCQVIISPEVLGKTLVLDFGARTTNMIMVSPEVFFCRSIPSGGLAISTTIAKEIHVSAEEAETLKISRGSVGLAPNYAPPADPLEANLARIARQSLLKTQADISRSISHYRSNMGGDEPTSILLAGGMASMPYLVEFVVEKFQKETGFLSEILLSSVTMTISESARDFVDSNRHSLAELYGGSLGLMKKGGFITVSLLPPSLARKRDFFRKIPFLSAAAVLFLSSLGAWGFFADGAAKAIRNNTSELQQKASLAKQSANKIKVLLGSQQDLTSNASELLSLVLQREAYPRIVAELTDCLPDRFLWISEVQANIPANGKPQASLTPSNGGASSPMSPPLDSIQVKGFYLDNPRQASVIDDFVEKLQSSSFFNIEDKNKVVIQRSSPNGEFWAYPFVLKLPLRQPVPSLP